MNYSEMSAEELALELGKTTQTAPAEQQQTTTTEEGDNSQQGVTKTFQQLLDEGKNSEEIAEELSKQTTDKPEDAEEKPKKVKTPVVEKEVLSEDFVNKIDEKLFKTEKLLPYNTEDGKGYIKPSTWEELGELIEANITDRVDKVKGEEKQVLVDEMLKESTSAVRFILENASKFKSPEDMLPLIQSVKQQDDFAELDPSNPDHQEYIIHSALSLQGLDNETIKEEIQDLKDRNKLEARAEKLKPSLDAFSARQTEAILKAQEDKQKQDQIFWNGYFETLNTDLISAKDVDGMKLKTDQKNIIANMLLPNQQTGTLPIFSMIDEQVGKGNIKLLSKLSLLLSDEATFDEAYGSKKVAATAAGLQRTLRGSLKSSSDDGAPSEEQTVKTVQKRPAYGNFLTK